MHTHKKMAEKMDRPKKYQKKMDRPPKYQKNEHTQNIQEQERRAYLIPDYHDSEVMIKVKTRSADVIDR